MAACKLIQDIIVKSDGRITEDEVLWEEETQENELDAGGLHLSFMIMQALRFYIGGILPNEEGAEVAPDGSVHVYHSHTQTLLMLVVGLFSVGTLVVYILLLR